MLAPLVDCREPALCREGDNLLAVRCEKRGCQDVQGSCALLNGVCNCPVKIVRTAHLGPRVAGDKPGAYKIIGERDDRDLRSCLLDHTGGEVSTCRDNVQVALDQFGRHLRQPVGLPISVPYLDKDVGSLDVTRLAKALPKRLHPR